ncbi:hypothetical protein ACWV16_02730 [Achromobacter xylosoxidans]|uniref:hypothetical protein n=1 Tax=Alcaligenes xylosoxydans xylosoxydans TaxID=85698 RepID=UPI0006BF9310|nr:hypothetical protein [Achromobacter xylosoxidans]QKI68391.1 hypothetical protein HPS44_01370 [Achromobacter xylosoxidans]WPQ36643.1 hypothetical protein SLH34_07265 [Achromobacter xylosoxidans]CUI30349.1 Uncharacterised protein [Achromobacter xylosoxidans]CUI51190.1 Uncharacterised protein [Achromobacter xylosoxidans]CUI99928.1 Uncharacterised protein [Achromobacter xylosoxidans]
MNDIAALRSGANFLQHEVGELQQDHARTANNYSRLAQLLDGLAVSKQEHRANLEAQYPTAFQPDARNGEAVARGADEILQQQRLVHECLSLVGALSEDEQMHGERLNRVSERLHDALALVRHGHTPSVEDATRLRSHLQEVRDDVSAMADRHQVMIQANVALMDMIGQLKAEAPNVPPPVRDPRQALDNMRAEGDIQIPQGGVAAVSTSTFTVPTSFAVSSRIAEGLQPGSSLGSRAIVSADESSSQVVCNNLVRISAQDLENPARLERIVHTLTHNPARGCFSVAAERQGELTAPSAQTLSGRMFNTAILVIDPKRLGQQDQEGLGGLLFEPTVSTECSVASVGQDAIIAAIVPQRTGGHAGVPTLQVGDTTANFEMRVGGGSTAFQNLTMPDYAQGLTDLLRANPDRTMLIHLTRFK